MEDEIIIYNILKDEIELSRGKSDKKSGFRKSKTLRILNNLIDKNIIQKLGSGPGTTFGLLIDNIALGISIGLAIGIAVGVS